MAAVQRNHTIDILRIVSAFFIILLHNFSGSGHPFGEELVALSRFAVPLFFMISGYFSAHFTPQRHRRQIGKLLILTMLSNIGYFLVRLWEQARAGNVPGFFREKFTGKAFLDFFLLGESSVASHLWFLSALLYVLVVDAVVTRLVQDPAKRQAAVAVLAAVLFLGGLAYYHINTTVLHRELPWQNYRNFAFLGLPSFWAGKLVFGSRLEDLHLPNFVWPLLFLALELVVLLEFRLLGVKEIYLGSALLAGALLLFGVSHPMPSAGRIVRGAAEAGRRYALPVYMVHIFFLDQIRNLYFSRVPWGTYRPGFYFIPMLVFAASLLLAMVYDGCKRGLMALRSR